MTATPIVQGELEYVSFLAAELLGGTSRDFTTGANECGIVVLSGKCDVRTATREWTGLGGRMTPFTPI